MSKYNGKERREDRREARHQKHEDIKNGESRKDARKDKHEMKKADRKLWKEEGHSIVDDMSEFGLDAVEDVADVAGDLVPVSVFTTAPNPEESSNG